MWLHIAVRGSRRCLSSLWRRWDQQSSSGWDTHGRRCCSWLRVRSRAREHSRACACQCACVSCGPFDDRTLVAAKDWIPMLLCRRRREWTGEKKAGRWRRRKRKKGRRVSWLKDGGALFMEGRYSGGNGRLSSRVSWKRDYVKNRDGRGSLLRGFGPGAKVGQRKAELKVVWINKCCFCFVVVAT